MDISSDTLEELADIEHERWSDWQGHVHNQGEKQEDGSLLIPAKLVKRWERQINTPYEGLSETDKEKDREQVERYLPVLDKMDKMAKEAFEAALMAERVVERVAKLASRLHLGPDQQGPQEIRNSAVLKGMKKFRKRPQGDLASAIEVAAGLAKQTGKDWYAWKGNSYMHAIWNVTDRESKALVPFSNIGQFVYRVTPELEIFGHEVLGRGTLPSFDEEE